MSKFDRNFLKSAPQGFVHHCPARFQDIDAAGLVFFARIFDLFHDAYLAFMEQGGLPHAAVLKAAVWGAPIQHAEADFRSPIRFGDMLEVGLVGVEWKQSELTIGYRVAIAGGAVAATGITRHIIVGFPKFSRIEPPEELRAVFRPLEQH